MEYYFSGIVYSDLKEIEKFTNDIYDNLLKYISDFEILFEIRLILNELIINAAIHGNSSEKEKKIYVNLEISDTTLKITIIDEGSGIQQKTKKISELCSDGRGLIIVKSLVDNIIFSKNKVFCEKKLKAI